MSLIKSSTKEYKSSENDKKNLITSTANNIWSKEDMVASTQNNNNNNNNNNNTSSNTEYTDLSQLSALLYSPTLSSSSQDLENNLSQDESIIAIAQNNDLFSLQEYINVEELQKYTNDKIFSCPPSTTPAPLVTPVKPIKPALPLNSTVSTPNSEIDNSDPSFTDESSSKKKAAGGRKRKAESLEEKEQRQRERILRNRHAAQMSRDKKRRQMADLESQNLILKEENEHLSKRLKVVEEENMNLSAKLDVISAQLNEIQSHLAVSEMTKVLLDGVRGSARHVKMRNLYGILSQIHSLPTWMLQQPQQVQIMKQLFLIFSIVFWTMTGQRKNFLLLDNQMALRGSTISGMKRVPRDWRKYPP
ncbi:hypothetical protein C1645_14318 [Glomus cerebriforme]|uniref:BZIP domain-containing protein n=1 Tax=Glomus cerebriforme TaxID=658196 RepID=A0A397T852_9GLOM|nr:hypothetical protein C1645_14318 [Glomus cerebriforme]